MTVPRVKIALLGDSLPQVAAPLEAHPVQLPGEARQDCSVGGEYEVLVGGDVLRAARVEAGRVGDADLRE